MIEIVFAKTLLVKNHDVQRKTQKGQDKALKIAHIKERHYEIFLGHNCCMFQPSLSLNGKNGCCTTTPGIFTIKMLKHHLNIEILGL